MPQCDREKLLAPRIANVFNAFLTRATLSISNYLMKRTMQSEIRSLDLSGADEVNVRSCGSVNRTLLRGTAIAVCYPNTNFQFHKLQNSFKCLNFLHFRETRLKRQK